MFLLRTWVPSLVGVTADRACAMPTLARLQLASPSLRSRLRPSRLMLIEHRHCRRVFHELSAASDRPRPLTQPNPDPGNEAFRLGRSELPRPRSPSSFRKCAIPPGLTPFAGYATRVHLVPA